MHIDQVFRSEEEKVNQYKHEIKETNELRDMS